MNQQSSPGPVRGRRSSLPIRATTRPAGQASGRVCS